VFPRRPAASSEDGRRSHAAVHDARDSRQVGGWSAVPIDVGVGKYCTYTDVHSVLIDRTDADYPSQLPESIRVCTVQLRVSAESGARRLSALAAQMQIDVGGV
jgi:hypothetical protein